MTTLNAADGAKAEGAPEIDSANEPPSQAKRQRAVSMADVARHAGVSPQTVSRVSNGLDTVLESTRQRVLASMEEIGYRPNSAARALKSGRFRTIGVIVFTLSSTGNVLTVEAIVNSAAEKGYATTLIPAEFPTKAGVRGAFQRMGELAVDGVILLLEVSLIDATHVFVPPGVPVVVADSDAGDQYMVVDSDQIDGARDATKHLLDLGHETVWHVAGPEGSFSAARRADAWKATLEQAGRAIPPLERGDWSASSGYDAGKRLAAREDCTAIFAANDSMALGVLRAMQEAGRDVPGDVSVVGFDDISSASQFHPPLTTIQQDFSEVGRRCVTKLIAQLDGHTKQHGTELVPTQLVLRESTAPPRLHS